MNATFSPRGQLANELLESLQERIEVGRDDYDRKEARLTPGCHDLILAFIDRVNDSINPQVTAEWLKEQAKDFAEQDLVLSISPVNFPAPISASFRKDGKWACGFGLTPEGAVADAYKRQTK